MLRPKRVRRAFARGATACVLLIAGCVSLFGEGAAGSHACRYLQDDGFGGVVTVDYCPVHVVVELQAWIPKQAVVDPVQPTPVPYTAITRCLPDCYTPPTAADRLLTTVSTSFRGDGHDDYDGTYRVRPVAEFDAWAEQEQIGPYPTYDSPTGPAKVTSFRKSASSDYGETHLDYVYRFRGRTARCERSATATRETSVAQVADTRVRMTLSSRNPLGAPQILAALTPPIDSAVEIDTRNIPEPLTTSGMTLDYTTDEFPSHGIRVYEDGEIS
jgi:hypothetical protein